jgi:hypothetical protein
MSNAVMSRIGRRTVATVLAIVLCGAGHIYLRHIRRGVAILTIGIGLCLIAFPGYLGFQNILGIDFQAVSVSNIINIGLISVGFGSGAFWVWQIIDARKLANQAIAA